MEQPNVQSMKTLLLALLLVYITPTDAKTHRSAAAKAEFQHQHPCPATGSSRGACPGWVKDHIKALACGGADSPENLQWQTTADAKAKDKWERKSCSK